MKHRFVEDPRPSASPCARGCTIRDRHADHCTADAETPCWGCLPRPADAGSPLCHGCGRHLGQGIAEMPALALELWRGLHASAGGIASGSTQMMGSPDFARARAAVEHVGQLAHDFGWLTREVAEIRTVTHPALGATPLVGVQRAATWLTRHADWMLTRAEVPDWLGTVSEGRSTAYRLIDRPPRSQFDLPDPCPGKGETCGLGLRVTMYEENDPRVTEVYCKADPPHRFEPHQWLRLGKRLGYDKSEAAS